MPDHLASGKWADCDVKDIPNSDLADQLRFVSFDDRQIVKAELARRREAARIRAKAVALAANKQRPKLSWTAISSGVEDFDYGQG